MTGPPQPERKATGEAGLREAYRLRRYRRLGPHRHNMEPIQGETRLFSTWRAASDAASEIAGHIVTQSVMVDDEGTVVFPPGDGQTPKTQGRWKTATAIRYKGTGPKPEKTADKPQAPPASNARRDRADRQGRGHMRLDPRVARRLAEIRTRNPGFGRNVTDGNHGALPGEPRDR